MHVIPMLVDLTTIFTLLVATALMGALLVALVKWFPSVKRTTENLERASFHLVSTSQNLEQTTTHLATITGDFADKSQQISSNLAEASKNVAESSGYIRTAVRLLELLGPAGAAAQLAQTGLGRLLEWFKGQGSGFLGRLSRR